ncbi:MAG: IS481 family transposase, partial [Anaerolineales bacterium]|nr:IS481 family transposase [Anaerolineales bacterium]
RYAALYNQSIPQKALGHLTPIQALIDWYDKQPELFNRRVYNLTGLDM